VGKLKLAFEIGRFVVFIVTSLKTLVLNAEEQLPEGGHGKEKFEAVKTAIVMAAKYAEIADEAIEAVDGFIDDQIEGAVAKFINKSE
jgi:hypothetical protein